MGSTASLREMGKIASIQNNDLKIEPLNSQIEAGPYCPIPEHYFERKLSNTGGLIQSITSIDPWVTGQLSSIRK